MIESDYSEEDPNDVMMLESLDSLSSVEKKYRSLISVLSNMSVHELQGGLCRYIKSIKGAETLE